MEHRCAARGCTGSRSHPGAVILRVDICRLETNSRRLQSNLRSSRFQQLNVLYFLPPFSARFSPYLFVMSVRARNNGVRCMPLAQAELTC
jgi:hypothetical protein